MDPFKFGKVFFKKLDFIEDCFQFHLNRRQVLFCLRIDLVKFGEERLVQFKVIGLLNFILNQGRVDRFNELFEELD